MSLYFAAGGVDSDLFLQLPDLLSGSLRWSASARPKNSLGQPSIWRPTSLPSSPEEPWSWMEAFWPATSINNCAQREE